MSLALGSCPTLQSCPLLKVFGQQTIKNLLPIALAAFIPIFSCFFVKR